VGGRDRIAVDLQNAGFTFRMAREIVDTVLAVCLEGIQKNGKVETPLGTLQGGSRGRVRFVSSPALEAAILAADWEKKKMAEREIRPAQKNGSVQCPVCGSEWLAEVEFRRYWKEAYSSVAGGDIVPLDQTGVVTVPVKICLCGYPAFAPRSSRTPNELMQSLLDSLGLAQTYLKDVHTINDKFRELENGLASWKDVDHLQKRLDTLQKEINKLKMETADGSEES